MQCLDVTLMAPRAVLGLLGSRLSRHAQDGLAVTTESNRVQWFGKDIRLILLAWDENDVGYPSALQLAHLESLAHHMAGIWARALAVAEVVCTLRVRSNLDSAYTKFAAHLGIQPVSLWVRYLDLGMQ